ncbi:hypothetical protein D018_2174B, partial [Vibrio parahaemolyticus VP2007-007]
HQAHLKLGH